MKKRNCRFEVRFTKDELSDLTKKARKARLTNAAFIRRAVCGAEVREAPERHGGEGGPARRCTCADPGGAARGE